jgi:hypothetical protein
MIIFGERKFIQAAFDSEAELEQVVVNNAEYLFGPSSIYLPKALISTQDGSGTIPHGFAIDLAARRWFIVEAELSKHSVWSHIAPQVAKQLIAASNSATKQLPVNLVVERVRTDEELMEKFAEQTIPAIDIRRVLGEIVDTKPIMGIPIDDITNDLWEWANTLKVIVRLWKVRKLVEFGRPETFMYEFPEEFQPALDTEEDGAVGASRVAYSVTLVDLLLTGLLQAGEKLFMAYKPRKGERKTYEGVVTKDGAIEVLGKVFSAPSYAALYAMEDAGTTRTTVNGWNSWKTASGKLLDKLRDEYLAKQAVPKSPEGTLYER